MITEGHPGAPAEHQGAVELAYRREDRDLQEQIAIDRFSVPGDTFDYCVCCGTRLGFSRLYRVDGELVGWCCLDDYRERQPVQCEDCRIRTRRGEYVCDHSGLPCEHIPRIQRERRETALGLWSELYAREGAGHGDTD